MAYEHTGNQPFGAIDELQITKQSYAHARSYVKLSN
jgi:hypothetical protein